MSNSLYVAHAQLAASLHYSSARRHLQGLIENGLLGEAPSEKLVQAALFETGCLHLYLLDHELRRGHKEDEFLNELWSWIAKGLIEIFPNLTADEATIKILGWRLGRYEDVTASVEADETYGPLYQSTKRDDILYRLAGQFFLCLNASASVLDHSGIYLGVVAQENFDVNSELEPQQAQAKGALKEMFYEYVLPIQQIAALWAEDTPFYEKSLEELDGLAVQGQELAEDIFKQRFHSRVALYAWSRWMQMYSDKTQFLLGKFSHVMEETNVSNYESDENNEWEVGTDNNGYPHLLAVPVPEGTPNSIGIRKLLFFAYDLGVGITTLDLKRESDDGTVDLWALPLSLGGVSILLRDGNNYSPFGLPLVDLSQPEELEVSLPDAWNVSGAGRIALAGFYRDSEETIREELGDYSGGRYGWIEDGNGEGILVLSPANQSLISYASWLLGPGQQVIGEMQPRMARYPITATDDENDIGTGRATIEYQMPTPEGLDIAYDEDSLFVRAHQIIYGTAGEPYEVIQQTDDSDEGRPLLDFALPCYDSGRGIALLSADGVLIWRLAFGDLIGYLRDGTLFKPEDAFGISSGSDGDGVYPGNPVGAATKPDGWVLPGASQAGIGWILRRAGIANPKMGFVDTDTGKSVLLFGPAPTSPDLLHWVQWRIAWYLPIGAPLYTLTNHAPLLPFDMLISP